MAEMTVKGMFHCEFPQATGRTAALVQIQPVSPAAAARVYRKRQKECRFLYLYAAGHAVCGSLTGLVPRCLQ